MLKLCVPNCMGSSALGASKRVKFPLASRTKPVCLKGLLNGMKDPVTSPPALMLVTLKKAKAIPGALKTVILPAASRTKPPPPSRH